MYEIDRYTQAYGPRIWDFLVLQEEVWANAAFACIQCGWNENTIIQILQVFCITNVQMKHELHEVRRAQTYTRFGSNIFGIQ
jgi:hypothetical protein